MLARADGGAGDIVRTDPRRAGGVVRYSTWPVLKEQTNGQHTWQVMRILHDIWPEVTARAMVAALHHDSGELGSGEIPYPHKANNPELKAIMDSLEIASLADQGIVVPDPGPEWRWRIKTADLVEMFEHGLDEIVMGNRYGIPIVRAMEDNLRARVDSHDNAADRQAVADYLEKRWARFRELEGLT